MPLDELAAPVGAPTVDWPPLDRSLLGEARPAPATFPLPLLPGRWRGWVEASSRVFGSADYLAHCLLAGLSGVCGAGIRIEVAPHWREPLLLWQALVGGPSSGKSAAFARVRALLAAVRPVEGSSDSAAPAVPVDAGLDQVDTALGGSARGVLLWREDLADWMDEARRRPARPAWLAGWSAGPARIGPFSQECFAAGIAGTITPASLSREVGGAGFIDGDSALAARFLYVWPERGAAPSLADPGADDAGITALLQKIADFAGDRRTPTVLPLDDAAIPRLEQVMVSVQRRADEADGVDGRMDRQGRAGDRAAGRPPVADGMGRAGRRVAAGRDGAYRGRARIVVGLLPAAGAGRVRSDGRRGLRARRPPRRALAEEGAGARDLARGHPPRGARPGRQCRGRGGRAGAPRGGRAPAAAARDRLDQGRPAPPALGGASAGRRRELAQLAQVRRRGREGSCLPSTQTQIPSPPTSPWWERVRVRWVKCFANGLIFVLQMAVAPALDRAGHSTLGPHYCELNRCLDGP